MGRGLGEVQKEVRYERGNYARAGSCQEQDYPGEGLVYTVSARKVSRKKQGLLRRGGAPDLGGGRRNGKGSCAFIQGF